MLVVAVVAAIAIANSTSNTAVHIRHVVGHDAQGVVDLSRRQLGAQDSLGPERAQLLEEAARLAVGVVQLGPAGHVLLGHRFEDRQGASTVTRLNEGAAQLVRSALVERSRISTA